MRRIYADIHIFVLLNIKMNMCYNIIAGGRCIEDLEVLRSDPDYMNALEAERIPDPTTAGDFLREFDPVDHKY